MWKRISELDNIFLGILIKIVRRVYPWLSVDAIVNTHIFIDSRQRIRRILSESGNRLFVQIFILVHYAIL